MENLELNLDSSSVVFLRHLSQIFFELATDLVLADFYRTTDVLCYQSFSGFDVMVNHGVPFLVFYCKCSFVFNCAGNYGNSTRIDVNHKPKATMDVFPRYNTNRSSYI
jgi:hypothetical protein